MKLKIFNSENCKHIQRKTPIVSIEFQKGLFRINGTAAERIGIKNNDQVSVAFDEQDELWYIFKSKENGFFVRDNAQKDGSLIFNSAPLTRRIADFMNYTKKSGRCIVGSEPVTFNKVDYFPLIVENLKND